GTKSARIWASVSPGAALRAIATRYSRPGLRGRRYTTASTGAAGAVGATRAAWDVAGTALPGMRTRGRALAAIAGPATVGEADSARPTAAANGNIVLRISAADDRRRLRTASARRQSARVAADRERVAGGVRVAVPGRVDRVHRDRVAAVRHAEELEHVRHRPVPGTAAKPVAVTQPELVRVRVGGG